LGVPVIASDQPPPVVQPAVAPLHLPATFAGLMDLPRTARPTAAIGPFPTRDGRLHPPASQLLSEIRAVVALVSCQAGRTLLGTAFWPGHAHLVYHLQPYSDLSHVSCTHQKGQGQAVSFSQQMDGAAFAFPAIGDVLSPFLAGTKLPSRKAWLQSSLPCWSKAPRKVSQICSHTPCSCHSWRRRWQVERLPHSLGRSFQRAPERNTQRMPLRVLRSSALGRPRFFWDGSSGTINSYWSSRRSPSITQASRPKTWGEV
jgi:hypothetical protein